MLMKELIFVQFQAYKISGAFIDITFAHFNSHLLQNIISLSREFLIFTYVYLIFIYALNAYKATIFMFLIPPVLPVCVI